MKLIEPSPVATCAIADAMIQAFATMLAHQHQRTIDLINNLQLQFSGVVEGLAHGMKGGGKGVFGGENLKEIQKSTMFRTHQQQRTGAGALDNPCAEGDIYLTFGGKADEANRVQHCVLLSSCRHRPLMVDCEDLFDRQRVDVFMRRYEPSTPGTKQAVLINIVNRAIQEGRGYGKMHPS